ncbi:hypothetical protein [Brevibacterium oceani]|uniref:hypothetical protein n=1 Tax=Brevibacterium oceani TaxID=358099 RepID=UPI0015E65C2F|nr:hypothetical protein [Brevibacterium oceani]
MQHETEYEYQSPPEDGQQMISTPADGSTQSQAPGVDRRGAHRSGTFVRRLIAFGIMLAFAYGVFHVVFLTDLLDPLLAYAEPVKDGVAWVAEDPKRAWVALAAIIVPHIGLYYMIFEDRK